MSAKRVSKKEKTILWFDEINNHDVALVGGKNASLGEMYQKLSGQGINIPYGFAVTAKGYRNFIDAAGIRNKIEEILTGLNTHDVKDLARRGHRIRETILKVEFPKELEDDIVTAYKKLSGRYKSKATDVAVRSSATAEDLPDASFAGQQETYLNIEGEYSILESVKKCMASLFTNRAISYREDKGFNHFDVELSVTVQKMVRSDLASSGVMFSIDTETGFKDAVLINAIYGLGENIVQGIVNPDSYYVFKPTLLEGYKEKDHDKFSYKPILSKTVGSKRLKLIYSLEGSESTKNEPVSEEDKQRFVLTDHEVLVLARWACLIEEHYKLPMDIEWAKDGRSGELYVVQARPETVHTQTDKQKLIEYKLKKKEKSLLSGDSIGSKIGIGKARVVGDVTEIEKFKEGEVLVTEITDPDWEPIMKIASAIVTNSGGRTSHAAIVSREFGIPCIVGTGNATKIIKNGMMITVSCAEGEVGRVYNGAVPFDIKETDLKKIPDPQTEIMMNVGDPQQAFDFSFIPNEGVGLAREEMIILNFVKVHPKALIDFDKIKDPETKEKIEEITMGYPDKKEFFVDKLAQGIARIAAAFYPKDVILRTVDLKSNEYASLVGGKDYEPEEGNPMLGWRGASRYYSQEYKDAFDLECQAIKKVRDDMGLYNLKVMIPFCRTPEEGQKVIKILEKNGLKRSKIGGRKKFEDLDIYVMCEIPSNVILADEFADIFDGFSIGSNDLTQLTLGVDRDSSMVAHVFDERNEAIKKTIAEVIRVAKKRKRKIGICGQGPSDLPEFAEFLVEQGIDSISLTPDTVIKTRIAIDKKEKNLKRRKSNK
ncbi:phosphoenolpyruvate synthase [Patescibacteria group bacterium]|nr:phosphoenolpyruvate synthase [Patescibacteria group bacterium]